MGFYNRLLLFLYGLPNIAGSTLALGGLGLYFAGIIDKYWFLIVVGLYAVGVLGAPSNREFQLQIDREADVEQIRDSLQRLLKTIKGHVAKETLEKVRSIIDSILSVLPKLLHTTNTTHAIYTVKETALSYLPETLENYLRLPRAYARFHTLSNGKTAQNLLIEQLDVLDRHMKAIVEDIHRDDINSLQAHGRFLKDRFQQSDQFLA